VEDLKLYIFNSLAFLISLSDVEVVLKIILLVCTIVYTVKRIQNERTK
jgi:hypothetical protein